MNEHRCNRLRGPRQGFTLIELLVAMTIFITVLTGVAALFNSAIRATKQGFQNQEAFEIARGAMDVIERDLNRAFTARDQGDVYNFYGTPIGFSFIGLIADADGNDNVGRITYVIYHDPNAPAGERDSLNTMSTVTTDPVYTYHLLRYVEPGGEDLESYPVDWSDPFPLLHDIFPTYVFSEIIQGAVNDSNCPDFACEDEVRKAKRREIWIRMLSGGDLEVPSAWNFLPEFTQDNFDPADYVVAENIRYIDLKPGRLDDEVDNDGDDIIDNANEHLTTALAYPRIGQFQTANYDDSEGLQPFFTYGDLGIRNRSDINGLIQATDPVTNQFLFKGSSNIPLYETETVPIRLRYWNDRRNIEYAQQQMNRILSNNFDDDGDGFIDNLDEANGINVGSPLDARPPIEFSINFTLFFPSPFPGAPDFNETFTQRIDLPTGYRRAITTPIPEL